MPPTEFNAALFMTTSVPEGALATGMPTAASDAESGGAEAFAALLEDHRIKLNKNSKPIDSKNSASDCALACAASGQQVTLPDAEPEQGGSGPVSVSLEVPELAGPDAAADGPVSPLALWTLASPAGNALPEERQAPGSTPHAADRDDGSGIDLSEAPVSLTPFPPVAAAAETAPGDVGGPGRASAAIGVGSAAAPELGENVRSSAQGTPLSQPSSAAAPGVVSSLPGVDSSPQGVVNSGAAAGSGDSTPGQRVALGEAAAAAAAAAQLTRDVATEPATPEPMRRAAVPGIGLPASAPVPADALSLEHGEHARAGPIAALREGLQGRADPAAASVAASAVPAAVAPPPPSAGVRPGPVDPGAAAPAASPAPAAVVAAEPAPGQRAPGLTAPDAAAAEVALVKTDPATTALPRPAAGHAQTLGAGDGSVAGLPRSAMVPGAASAGPAGPGTTTGAASLLPVAQVAAPREAGSIRGISTRQGAPIVQGASGAAAGPGRAPGEHPGVDAAMAGPDPLAPVSTAAVPIPGAGVTGRAPLPRGLEMPPNGPTGQTPIPGVVGTPVSVPGDLPPGSPAGESLGTVADASATSHLPQAIASREHATAASVGAPTPPAGGRSIEAPVAPAPPGMPLPMLLASANGTLGSELGEKILWLSGHNLRGAEIQLDPPELGPLQIQIHNHREGTSVQFTTHTAVARDAVESHIGRLRELLEGSGLSLLDVNVSHQQRQGQRQQEQAVSPLPALRDRLATAGEGPVEAPRRRQSGLVDAYA